MIYRVTERYNVGCGPRTARDPAWQVCWDEHIGQLVTGLITYTIPKG